MFDAVLAWLSNATTAVLDWVLSLVVAVLTQLRDWLFEGLSTMWSWAESALPQSTIDMMTAIDWSLANQILSDFAWVLPLESAMGIVVARWLAEGGVVLVKKIIWVCPFIG